MKPPEVYLKAIFICVQKNQFVTCHELSYHIQRSYRQTARIMANLFTDQLLYPFYKAEFMIGDSDEGKRADTRKIKIELIPQDEIEWKKYINSDCTRECMNRRYNAEFSKNECIYFNENHIFFS